MNRKEKRNLIEEIEVQEKKEIRKQDRIKSSEKKKCKKG